MKHTLSIFFGLFLFFGTFAQRPTPEDFVKSYNKPLWKIKGNTTWSGIGPQSLQVEDSACVVYVYKIRFLSNVVGSARAMAFNNKNGKLTWISPYNYTTEDCTFETQYNKLYFALSDSLICINPATGKRVWVFRKPGNSFNIDNVFIRDSTVYMISDTLETKNTDDIGSNYFELKANTGNIIKHIYFPYLNCSLSFIGNNRILSYSSGLSFGWYNLTTEKELWGGPAAVKETWGNAYYPLKCRQDSLVAKRLDPHKPLTDNDNVFNPDSIKLSRAHALIPFGDTVFSFSGEPAKIGFVSFTKTATLNEINFRTGKILAAFPAYDFRYAGTGDSFLYTINRNYSSSDSTCTYTIAKINLRKCKEEWKVDLPVSPVKINTSRFGEEHMYINVDDSNHYYISIDSILFCYSQDKGHLIYKINLHTLIDRVISTNNFILLSNPHFNRKGDCINTNLIIIDKNDTNRRAILKIKDDLFRFSREGDIVFFSSSTRLRCIRGF
jgi:hypothetical protein